MLLTPIGTLIGVAQFDTPFPGSYFPSNVLLPPPGHNRQQIGPAGVAQIVSALRTSRASGRSGQREFLQEQAVCALWNVCATGGAVCFSVLFSQA